LPCRPATCGSKAGGTVLHAILGQLTHRRVVRQPSQRRFEWDAQADEPFHLLRNEAESGSLRQHRPVLHLAPGAGRQSWHATAPVRPLVRRSPRDCRRRQFYTGGPKVARHFIAALLQAAFSHNGFGQKYDGQHDGFFRNVMAGGLLRGPIHITHSKLDIVVGLSMTALRHEDRLYRCRRWVGSVSPPAGLAVIKRGVAGLAAVQVVVRQ